MEEPFIKSLFSKRVIDLDGQQLVELIRYAIREEQPEEERQHDTASGVAKLAEALDCSQSQIYMLMRQHILDDAVVSRIGRRTVFDVNIARKAAQKYMNETTPKERYSSWKKYQ